LRFQVRVKRSIHSVEVQCRRGLWTVVAHGGVRVAIESNLENDIN
jgi:hypothetical protein